MDPIWVQFVHDHDDVVAVEYHTWWPGNQDPYYQHNIPENTARTQYYGVNATPWEWVDGVIEPAWVYTYARIEAAYNTRKATPTSVSLSHAGYYDAGSGAVNLTVMASTDATLPAGNYRLHAVLTESDLFWAAPNGIQTHDFIMRDMFPDAGGTPVTFSGGLPQTAEAAASFDASGYDAANCEVIYFLQNFSTKEVLQAGSVPLSAIADQTAAGEAPAAFGLGRAYPNPFNPSTAIPVRLEREQRVRLAIVDVQGRQLRVLHDGNLSAGQHEFRWDGRDDSGAAVASGVYLARFAAGQTRDLQRLVLLK